MADEQLRDGEGVKTNVIVKGDPDDYGTRMIAIDKGIRELVGWVRRTSPGVVLDANEVDAHCVDRELGEFEIHGYVRRNECVVCKNPLDTTRFHPLWDLGGHAHGPCIAFHEERVSAGYPDAKTPAELEARYRADPTRNV